MATIHTGTTMVPTKLELLTDWLPRQPWYGAGGGPSLSRAGGFRLDDPTGAVGIEFAFVSDGEGTTYSVPMTYRGAPLPGAEQGLIGTSEHGVLGTRWIYDAAHDPVAVAQLIDLVCGRVQAQHQTESDTLDPSVGRSWTSRGRLTAASPLRVSDDGPGRTTIPVELAGDDPSEVRGLSLDLVRVMPGEATPGPGSVEVDWPRGGGTAACGTVAVVR
jgi:hypothetical protein